MRPALELDAAAEAWPIAAADAVACINMIHISPWDSTVGLVRGAGRVLPRNGTLFLYGPYFRAGIDTAPSNLAFDRDLRARNPAWGIRALEEVVALAQANGFATPLITEMPANNLSVVFRRG